jgi:hypothetical protein
MLRWGVVILAMTGGMVWADDQPPPIAPADLTPQELLIIATTCAAQRQNRMRNPSLEIYKSDLAICERAAIKDVMAERRLKQQQHEIAAARQAAEDERKANEAMRVQEEAEKQARFQAIAADPKAQQIAYSALLCSWTDGYNEAIHQISEYKKAAKIGGVLDLTEVNNWQEEAMRAKRHIGDARAALKRRKAKPVACKDPLVVRISPCMNDEAHSYGECDEAAPYFRIARGDE